MKEIEKSFAPYLIEQIPSSIKGEKIGRYCSKNA